MPIKPRKKGQNRPSQIRLTGFPPIMLIKTPEKRKKTKKIKKLKKRRQYRPSEIRLMPIKTPKNYKKNGKKGKIDLQI